MGDFHRFLVKLEEDCKPVLVCEFEEETTKFLHARRSCNNQFFGLLTKKSNAILSPLITALALPVFKYSCRSLKTSGSGKMKFTMSIPEAMRKGLEKEKERRKLDTIQETIRSILAEYFKSNS